MEDGRFQIIRIIFNRNSFLPIIKGSTESYLTGSRVHVIMRMHTVVILFMCIWFGIVGFGTIAYLTGATANKFSLPPLIASLMFLFGYGLMMWAFKYESSKAKDKLLELLEGEIDYK
jgi:CBS domain containing-hemolysin-like protein